MSVESAHNLKYHSIVPFKAQSLNASDLINKPIDKVETIVTSTVDTFTPKTQDKEIKKSHKTAIRVGSTVLVIGGLVALLNPKFSSKLIEKMKTTSAKIGTKTETSKTLSDKIYKKFGNSLQKTANFLDFVNNFNSAKDSLFKRLCTKKTKSENRIWQKTDSIIVGILKKPHETITKLFDNLSKQTVYKKYNKVQSRFNILNESIEKYKNKLPEQDKEKVDKLLKQIYENQNYFLPSSIQARLKGQENVMSDLEVKVLNKIESYLKGFHNNPNKKEHISKNLNFWAKEILKPQKAELEKQGLKQVEIFLGNGKNSQGLYGEIFDILSPKLTQEENSVLKEYLNKFSKRLQSANKTEYVEYFDKKRDLTLGSAPTDILSVIFGLGLSGIVISTADNKNERVSKALTVAFPAIAGLGVSTALTAFLYSGIKGMLCGSIASGGLSLVGNTVNRAFLKHIENTNKEQQHV